MRTREWTKRIEQKKWQWRRKNEKGTVGERRLSYCVYRQLPILDLSMSPMFRIMEREDWERENNLKEREKQSADVEKETILGSQKEVSNLSSTLIHENSL